MVVKANLSCEQEDTVAEGVVQLSKELKPGNSHSLRKIKAWSTSDKKMVFLTNESANHCIGLTSIKIYFISLEFNYARFTNIVFSEGLLSA